jgi:hypothetical protein
MINHFTRDNQAESCLHTLSVKIHPIINNSSDRDGIPVDFYWILNVLVMVDLSLNKNPSKEHGTA